MTQLAVIGRNLRELAAAANREHGAAVGAATEALGHAITAGEALLVARDLVPHGEWQQWVYENFVAPTMATAYMRLARYKHLLPPDVPLSQLDALRYLRGLPGTSGNAPPADVANLKDEGLRLFEAGFKEREVCRILGVGRGTVHRWKKGVVLSEPSDKQRQIASQRRKDRLRNRRLRAQALANPVVSGATDVDIWEARTLLERASEILRTFARREQNPEARGATVDALTKLSIVIEDVSVAADLQGRAA